MRKNIRGKIISVTLSLVLGILAVYLLHRFMIIDACFDMGSSMNEATGECDSLEHHEKYVALSAPLVLIYLVSFAAATRISYLLFNRIQSTIEPKP